MFANNLREMSFALNSNPLKVCNSRENSAKCAGHTTATVKAPSSKNVRSFSYRESTFCTILSLFGPALLSQNPQLISQTKIKLHSSCNKWAWRSFRFIVSLFSSSSNRKERKILQLPTKTSPVCAVKWGSPLRRNQLLLAAFECWKKFPLGQQSIGYDTKSFIDFRWTLMCCAGERKRCNSAKRYQSQESAKWIYLALEREAARQNGESTTTCWMSRLGV